MIGPSSEVEALVAAASMQVVLVLVQLPQGMVSCTQLSSLGLDEDALLQLHSAHPLLHQFHLPAIPSSDIWQLHLSHLNLIIFLL